MMRLRYETVRDEKTHIRHPLRSALTIGAVSAALLLPFGTINPVFADKAPMSAPSCPKNTVSHSFLMPIHCGYGLGYSPFYEPERRFFAFGYDSRYTAKSTLDKIKLMRETKVKYANAAFLVKYPHYDLLAQDYSIIHELNDSLPGQKRMSASEWATYLSGYVYLTRNYDAGTALGFRKSVVSGALTRTEMHYSADLRAAGYVSLSAEIYALQERLAAAEQQARLASKQNMRHTKMRMQSKNQMNSLLSDQAAMVIVWGILAISALAWSVIIVGSVVLRLFGVKADNSAVNFRRQDPKHPLIKGIGPDGKGPDG
jgi:hypothetical protein